MKKSLTLLLASSALCAQAATLNLQETVTLEVPQNELTTVFFMEATGPSPAELNAKTALVLKRAFALSSPTVKVVSRGIQTHPVYGPNGKTGKYTVRASVEVKSTEMDKASQVADQLAGFMAFERVSYAVSEATWKQVRDEQASQVAERFMRKAKTVAKALGYDSVEVDNVGLDVAAAEPVQPKVMALRAMAVADAAPEMGLAQAAGTQQVTTTMTGTVKLK